jgi:serine/threonine protein kinase
VTRDVYGTDVRFTVKEILAIAHDIGDALFKLHERGVNHGDVYGHNILYIPESSGVNPRAKLGDFGASFFYDVDHEARAELIFANELKAYGHLLTELGCRLDNASRENQDIVAVFDFLRKLASKCIDGQCSRSQFSVALDAVGERRRAARSNDIRDSPQ